jgi:hypothetical protein
MTNELIWQPFGLYQQQGNYDFGIMLNPEFARKTINAILSQTVSARIQKLPEEYFGFKGIEPYIFHENTCFVRQINVHGGDGKWLSLDNCCGGSFPRLDEPVKYSTHNLDYKPCSLDQVNLMRLFDLWVEYADIMIEESKR